MCIRRKSKGEGKEKEEGENGEISGWFREVDKIIPYLPLSPSLSYILVNFVRSGLRHTMECVRVREECVEVGSPSTMWVPKDRAQAGRMYFIISVSM